MKGVLLALADALFAALVIVAMVLAWIDYKAINLVWGMAFGR